MKINRLFALSSLTAILVACGGGSGETGTVMANDPNSFTLPELQGVYVDKYVGLWTTTCLADNDINESGRFISTISKKSNSALTVALTATRATGKNCTGTALPAIFQSSINDITYVDTVNDVDRFTYTGNGRSTSKIVGSVLNVGNELKLDAAGYPVIDFDDLATAFIKN